LEDFNNESRSIHFGSVDLLMRMGERYTRYEVHCKFREGNVRLCRPVAYALINEILFTLFDLQRTGIARRLIV
jgi:hypothetical protein